MTKTLYANEKTSISVTYSKFYKKYHFSIRQGVNEIDIYLTKDSFKDLMEILQSSMEN